MKKNPSNVCGDVGILMLMADVLHTIMTLRGLLPSAGDSGAEEEKCNEAMDMALKRLHNAVDYSAERAERLLKKSLAASPSRVAASLCIGVSPGGCKKLKSNKVYNKN